IFYPAVPRVFKNYELIISAARKLKEQSNIKFLLTISGTENAYAKYIISLAEGLDNVHFLGYLDKEKIDHCYNISDIVCFPSRLETWGLPLSEAKERGKWVLASDFPFTRETLGSYEKKAFFDSNNDDMLVKLIIDFKKGNLKKDISDANFIYRNENVLVGFDELVNFITEEH
ncbi:TPA: glycosyltransferase, partial [Escherichia coli]